MKKPAFQHFHRTTDFQPTYTQTAKFPGLSGVRAHTDVPTQAAAAKSALAGRGEPRVQQSPEEPERRVRAMETSPAQPGLPQGHAAAGKATGLRSDVSTEAGARNDTGCLGKPGVHRERQRADVRAAARAEESGGVQLPLMSAIHGFSAQMLHSFSKALF